MSQTRGLVLDVANQLGGVQPSVATLYDWSRYKHDGTMHNVTWTQRYAGLWEPVFNGTSAYIDAANADTEALAFSGGYTIMGWVNWVDTTNSEIVIARYELDVGGWELYLTYTGGIYSLTQRHHHAGTIVDLHPRSASYSVGWDEGINWFMTVVFQGSGTDCLHYRNGVALAVTSSTGGIRDFESTTQDLVIGTRFNKAANWYQGEMSQVKGFNYILSPAQIRAAYHSSKWLFGVPL